MTVETKPSAGELLAALLRAPEAVEPYLVYADWLQERGDPHGRLIAVQHALEARHDQALRDEEAQLVARLLGPLERGVEVSWRRGFVQQLTVSWEDEVDVPALLRRLRGLQVGVLLEDLTVGIYAGAGGAPAVVEALVALGPPLRRLMLGAFESPTGDLNGISWLELGDVSPLWKALPRLRELTLQGRARLGAIDHPALERFELRTGNLEREQLRAIVDARWPALRELKVWFGDSNYGAECGPDDVAPLLAGRGLPNLARLGLMNAEFTDDLCRALPGSAVLPRLKELDLSMGTLSDDGARVLLANRAAFAHLERLNLEANYVGEDLLWELKELCADVRLGGQRSADGGDRYVVAGE